MYNWKHGWSYWQQAVATELLVLQSTRSLVPPDGDLQRRTFRVIPPDQCHSFTALFWYWPWFSSEQCFLEPGVRLVRGILHASLRLLNTETCSEPRYIMPGWRRVQSLTEIVEILLCYGWQQCSSLFKGQSSMRKGRNVEWKMLLSGCIVQLEIFYGLLQGNKGTKYNCLRKKIVLHAYVLQLMQYVLCYMWLAELVRDKETLEKGSDLDICNLFVQQTQKWKVNKNRFA